MGITLADVQNWQPEQIDEVSQAAAQRARTSGEAAETLRNLSVFGTWKGEAGEAAQQAINQSATTLSLSQKEAFLVAMGAGKAAGDVRKVKNDLQSLLDYANAAPHVQIDLATNTVTPPDTTGWPAEKIEELRAKTEDVENRMGAVLAAAEEADADLARVLTAATGGDPGLPGEQGTNDGQSLQDGQLTPEEMARLEENTNLTPEQQEALVRGDLVLPTSQMEYLNNLSRSLDGKSPAEIRSMIDQMNANGQNGGAVADALQLLGNENITTAGDPAEGVPTQGGMANLPSGIRETFERPTRGIAVPTQGTNEQGNPTIEMPDLEHPFPELNNYRDIAAIVSAGDANLQHGTALDKALLDKSEEVLHGTHNPPYYPWAENVEWTQERIDPAVQDMLNAAGRDQMAVHSELTGADGKTPNTAFMEDLFTHQWADDGAAAGTLLNGTGAIPTDLTDPTQMDQATRAGQIMHTVDSFVGSAEYSPRLLDIPGLDGQSVGQVNPELTQALAEANKPYIDDMLGNSLDDSQGFRPLDDMKNPEMPVMRDLFAVIDSNADAATILNSQAYLNGLQYQANFEQSIIDGGTVNTGDLQSAGTLRGVIDSAANIADNDAIEYGNLQEVLAYESRGMWFDVAKTIGGELPFVDKILEWNDKIPGDPLHQIFVGDAPVGADPTYIAQQSSEMMQYAVAQRLIDANLGDPSVFQQFGLIDPETNQLRPIKQDDFGDFRSAFTDYFMGINPTVKIGIEDYEDAYRDALPTPTGHTGG
ncbi:hypothetical protein [Mycolicibacterium tusciae]|uniref:TPR repeat domain-containing protein n=1 Tax=Mycolicibacterium tusciae TaxID=75922 RepID=A0A1X0JHY3_9MYCO|nr:hypothetical protein [Mycolicibacterium tusciae]ORB62498.1 hypothetical protein BST47_22895 [Mycolicibacterium tusciae]